MLEYKAENDRSRMKLDRKSRHQQAVKKTKHKTKLTCKPNVMQGKRGVKWEKKGKVTTAKWLSGGISRRADREENPDQNKH